jgi:hypothetical protein
MIDPMNIEFIKDRHFVFDKKDLTSPFYSPEYNSYIAYSYSDVTEILSNHEIFTSEYGISFASLVKKDDGIISPLFSKEDSQHVLDRNNNIKNLKYLISNYNLKILTLKLKNRISKKHNLNFSKEISEWLPYQFLIEILGYEDDLFEEVENLCKNFHSSNSIDEYKNNMNNIINFTKENKSKLKENNVLSQYEINTLETSFFFGATAGVKNSINNLIVDLSNKNIQNKNNFIQESLRLGFTTPYLIRTVRVDTELSGVKLREGDVVMAIPGCANVDPQVWGAHSHLFDENRKKIKTLDFGSGAHQCIGIPATKCQLLIVLNLIKSSKKFSIEAIEINKKITNDSGLYKNILGEIIL